jgi:uncharacterized membrane protein YagU involved in acid resistance
MTTTNYSAAKTILTVGLLSGFLDGTAAIVQYLLKGGQHPEVIFKYIASAIFGQEAFSGGTMTIIYGVLFHFAIAFIFAIIFFFLYPILHKLIANDIVLGLLYGIVVWAIMNRLVVPATKIPSAPFNVKNAIIAALILMFCIGLPNALITGKYYERKSAS